MKHFLSLLSFLILLISTQAVFAGCYTADDVDLSFINDTSERYVLDEVGCIDGDSVVAIDSMLDGLWQAKEVLAAVVVVDTICGEQVSNFLENIFALLNGADNSLLFVLVTGNQHLYIQRSGDLESVLKSSTLMRVKTDKNGYFARGDWSGGLTKGVREVCDIVIKQMPEVESESDPEPELYGWWESFFDNFLFYYFCILFCWAVIGGALGFVYILYTLIKK